MNTATSNKSHQTVSGFVLKCFIFLFLVPASGLCANEKQLVSHENVTAKTYNRGTEGDGVIFMPQGNLSIGIKFAYTNQKDNDFSSIYSDTRYNGQIRSLSLTPQLFYTFRHNNSVGIQFGYESRMTDATNMPRFTGLGIDLENGDNIQKSKETTEQYSGRIAYYHYNPIADSRRFAIILGCYLGVGGGSGSIQTQEYDLNENKYVPVSNNIKSFNTALFFSPGLAIAISKIMMFEVNLDALGFEYSRISHLDNGKENGYESNAKFCFKPDIFSIKFGVSIQIPLF